MKRILSIDGGGTRGIIPLVILKNISEDLKQNPIELFDIFSGTSTGGIIVLGLAQGIPVTELMKLYKEQASQIFKAPFWRKIKYLKRLWGPKYSNETLIKLLREQLGNTTFGDINSKYAGEKMFIVPTFNLVPKNKKGKVLNFQPRVLNSFYLKHKDEKLIDIAMKTSAGPTYFPPYDNHVDGGLAINNPVLSAVSFSVSKNKSNSGRGCYNDLNKIGLGGDIQNLKVFSLGCGAHNINKIYKRVEKNYAMGLWHWKNYISDLLVINTLTLDYYAKEILGQKNYFRIQLDFSSEEAPETIRGKTINLDEKRIQVLKGLEQYAQQYYDKNKGAILSFLST